MPTHKLSRPADGTTPCCLRGFLGRDGLHKLRPPPSSSSVHGGRTGRRCSVPVRSSASADDTHGYVAGRPGRGPSPPRGPNPTRAASPSARSGQSPVEQNGPVLVSPGGKTVEKSLGKPYKGLVGDTPLVDLSSLSAKPGVQILGKAEFLNPSGSIKDRIAKHIISVAEEEGKLRPGGTVVAATSGNTGSAVAMVCAMKGHKCILYTNGKTSKEKCDSMASYGAKLVVGPSGVPADDPTHYQNLAATEAANNPDYFDIDQYDNARNPEAYYLSLGPEIWEQTEGRVTHFVAGASTGGTISGTGRYLKEQNRLIHVCMPDPDGSVFWDYWLNGIPPAELKPRSYQVEGVGKDSIPAAMDFAVVDSMMKVTDKSSFQMCRRVASEEGVLVGGSSGLNLAAAVELSKTAPEGSVIVAVMPDSGVKYLSKIFNDEWMEEKGFLADEEDTPQQPARTAPTVSVNATAAPAVEHPKEVFAPEKNDEVSLESFLDTVGDTLVDYVTSAKDMSQPVVRLSTPQDMATAFELAGTSMDLEEGAHPVSKDTLQSVLETTLELSVRTHHPYFFNQLYSAADPVAVAADWAAVAANTNVHTYEVAPVFTVVEQKVLAKMAGIIGGRFGEAHDGLFVPGGSLANTYGLHLARARALPNVNAEGMVGAPQLVAFTSAQSHYSFKKAAMLCGLGSDNLVAVDCDDTGAMCPRALAAAVEEVKAAGCLPFFVNATAGTTVTGAFDPFNDVADICEEHGMYMHVDGAWGAAVYLSANDDRRALMAGAERADSMTWNAHKMMGAPLQCSAFLTSTPGELEACNSVKAAYLFQPDKLHAEYDLGDKTIQCGRRADAFKLWFSWKALGDAGWAARVDHCIDLAEHFERRVRESGGVFEMARPRTFANVCFWYVPKELRPWDPSIVQASPELHERMTSVASAIKAEMQRQGLAMIGFQPLDDLPNFFRIVFPSGFNTTKADLDRLLDSIQHIGEEL